MKINGKDPGKVEGTTVSIYYADKRVFKLILVMFLSKKCEYGIRAALYVAANGRGGYLPIRQISQSLNLSHPFLTKILQDLTHVGIMKSYRGPNGGVALGRPGGEITLENVVLAIDGPDIFRECVLGMPGCGEQTPCPLHESWAAMRPRIQSMFSGATLAELAKRIKDDHLRLSDQFGDVEKLLNMGIE